MACQEHPALVKIGPVLLPSFYLTDRVSSQLGGLAVCWRPHPSGTRQYIMIYLFKASSIIQCSDAWLSSLTCHDVDPSRLALFNAYHSHNLMSKLFSLDSLKWKRCQVDIVSLRKNVHKNGLLLFITFFHIRYLTSLIALCLIHTTSFTNSFLGFSCKSWPILFNKSKT